MDLLPKFNINIFFQQDADAIFNARKRGKAIHQTTNIDAAGDEIELPVKEILKNHLPEQYYVGQGHIVDSNLKTSGQFDILIADNKGSPILFSSSNKTDYLTYESVYGVGEIKSTYYKSKNPVAAFCEKIKKVDENLKREATPPDQLSQDFSLSLGGLIKITPSDRPYKNPLLRFMFFVDSGDLNIAELGVTLKQYDNRYCPNFICFLDKGIVLKTEVLPLGGVEMYPEFISIEKEGNYEWRFYEFSQDNTSASCLAYVVYALNTHIRECIVLKPDLMKYHKQLFTVMKIQKM